MDLDNSSVGSNARDGNAFFAPGIVTDGDGNGGG